MSRVEVLWSDLKKKKKLKKQWLGRFGGLIKVTSKMVISMQNIIATV